MKMAAIAQEEPRQKDFWDINELSGLYPIKDMIEWGIKRNPYSLTETSIISPKHQEG